MSFSPICTHLSPGKIIFGPGSLSQLPDELDKGVKHLIITDPGLTKAGMTARVAQILNNAGVETEIFDKVHSDPPIEDCQAAADLAKQTGCGAVIALGGGSSIDAAKGAAVLMTKDKPLRHYGDGNWVEGPIAPLYAIPTTAGTGSEVTRVAVITDKAKKEKMAVRGVHLCPLVALLDPELLAELPPAIAAETGADALTHAVEAYVSLNANRMTDALAAEAIELIGQWLRPFAANPADSKAAEMMLLASCLAGQAFTNGGLGLAHSMGEPVGAYFHLSHGISCALYLPVIMEFNLPAAGEKYANVAALLGEDVEGLPVHQAAKLAVDAVIELFEDVDLPLTFEELGVNFEMNDQMIEDVWPQFSTKCNPRKATAEQIAALYCQPDEE